HSSQRHLCLRVGDPSFGELSRNGPVTGDPGWGVPLTKQSLISHHNQDFSRDRLRRGLAIDTLHEQVSHDLTVSAWLTGRVCRVGRLPGINHAVGIPG